MAAGGDLRHAGLMTGALAVGIVGALIATDSRTGRSGRCVD